MKDKQSDEIAREHGMEVVVRARLRPDQVERARTLQAAMYDELAAAGPQWLRQATFELDDGLSGLTFVQLDRDPAALGELESVQRYRAELAACCEEPPTTTVLRRVGAYRFP
jgi:hypothetical protein